jgi:sialic acid synthase SpsE/mannose-6-phosphate isomerase-like protein (cupin superfamily)
MIKLSARQPLFICDLANNHYGDIDHASKIIDGIANVASETNELVSVKFQFRNLENYIHKDFHSRRDIKYIDRFLSTKLVKKDFQILTERIRSNKLITMATPFDEDGVDWCRELDIDIIKIASASSDDYPLIDKIARAGKSVVASTAGLKLEEIDNLIFRLINKVPSLTIMHCVAIYPCEEELLNLNQIRSLQLRYPQVGIGFSTHERPETLVPVTVATSLGAVAFERHVGIKTEKYALNEYSSEPNQIKEWIQTHQRVRKTLGSANRSPASQKERETLDDLKRGIYSSVRIRRGDPIHAENTYLAFPLSWREGQLHAGILHSNLIATTDIEPDAPITLENTEANKKDTSHMLSSIILQVRGLLANARVEINPEAEIELSHHFGLSRFREFGATLITCFNGEYAKKLVVQLPRQKHPYHFHREKQETFQLLWGDMELTVEGHDYSLKPGELYTVNRGQWHKFHSLHGAVVEEVSTRAIIGDSYYEDPDISKLSVADRKTKISNWLRKFD